MANHLGCGLGACLIHSNVPEYLDFALGSFWHPSCAAINEKVQEISLLVMYH